jgi:tetratricopeptide (TPR) repeat protein
LKGEGVVSKEYKNSGKVAAFGDNAVAHGTTFNDYKADTIIINQPAPVSLAALHQLPQPSADFVGRKKELRELLKALEKGGVTISGLQGMGGIGKTTLALKLAQHLEPSYPDAQFYLDLKGASPQPLSTREAMAHVIRSYHPTAQMPEDDSSLQATYLSTLKGKKALLLMDNTSSAEQVKPLIPPTGSIMLVTSRNHFTLSGFFVKNLDTLEPKDAKQLLLKKAPRIGKFAEKIAELCGYLPLALEVAASALTKAVNITPDEYLQRLSRATKRLELVEASLLLSYELLSDELKMLWRVLSVFPNTFDDAAVASLWGMSVEDTKDQLAELISYSLIVWNETTRRYHLHDLMRIFADSRCNEGEHLKAKKIHSTYFSELLEKAEVGFEKGGIEMIGSLALFDSERENIEAGQAWAASHIEKEDAATRLYLSYFGNVVNLLLLRLHPHKLISWLETGLLVARILEAKEAEWVALNGLGLIHANIGEYRKAIEFYEQALNISRQIGNLNGEGATLGNLGMVYRDLGEPRKAIVFIEQFLDLAQKMGSLKNVSTALGNLGTSYLMLGENRKAIEFIERSLEIARQTGDLNGESGLLTNLGMVYYSIGKYREAIGIFEQSLSIACEIGSLKAKGAIFENLGISYVRLGETRKAIEYHQKSLEISLVIGSLQNEGLAFGNLGGAYTLLGETDKAIDFLGQALKIFQEIGDLQNEGIVSGSLGTLYRQVEKTDQAVEHFEQALKIARQIGIPSSESAALVSLGNIYGDLGENEKAIEFYEQGLDIARQIGDIYSEGAALGNLGISYKYLGELDKAIKYYEQALKIAREIGDLEGEGFELCHLARAYNQLGDQTQAISFAQQALLILEKVESTITSIVQGDLEKWKSEQP